MSKPAVVITGISGNLGHVLARLLHREERIIGIDHRPFPDRPKDLEFHQLDLRKRRAGEIFRKERIRAVVHLGIVAIPREHGADVHALNVVGTTSVLEYCVRNHIPKVVVLSSSAVYGPSPENSNFLTEEAPLMGAARFPELRGLVEVDMYAQSFFYRYPSIETVILRPVHVVGPTIRNAASDYLRLERPWRLAGFDPVVQLIHAEDVARAIRAVLAPGVRGVYNVVGAGEVPLSAALRELGRHALPIPHPAARPVLRLLQRYGLTRFRAPETDFLRYLCAVDGSRAVKDWGWNPRFSMRETIRSVIAE